MSDTWSCTCEHAKMWHKPECRIWNCECGQFQRATIRRAGDASWIKKGKASRKIHRGSIQ